jgi:hypothetical protein
MGAVGRASTRQPVGAGVSAQRAGQGGPPWGGADTPTAVQTHGTSNVAGRG